MHTLPRHPHTHFSVKNCAQCTHFLVILTHISVWKTVHNAHTSSSSSHTFQCEKLCTMHTLPRQPHTLFSGKNRAQCTHFLVNPTHISVWKTVRNAHTSLSSSHTFQCEKPCAMHTLPRELHTLCPTEFVCASLSQSVLLWAGRDQQPTRQSATQPCWRSPHSFVATICSWTRAWLATTTTGIQQPISRSATQPGWRSPHSFIATICFWTRAWLATTTTGSQQPVSRSATQTGWRSSTR